MRVRHDEEGFVPPGRLLKRPEFLAVAAARRKWAAPGVIVQARARADAGPMRVGFTASRKVGNAVVRNRARRRLRAAAAEVLGRRGAAGHDVVLIARTETAGRPFEDLVGDIARALGKLKAERSTGTPA
jgi:ribonuclease P protein component